MEVTGPGRTVYFAVQLGIGKSGKMGANAREQIEIAFENVKAALTQLYCRHRHEHCALPRGARQICEYGGPPGQHHNRRAATRPARRVV